MKGNALMIAVIMIGIMVALFIGYGLSFNLFGGEGSLQKTHLQYNIYTIEHSFDAAKLYMDASLNYAVYQACYDNLKRAGLSDITSETGKSGLAYLPSLTSEEFYSNLASVAETYLNRYASKDYLFLSEHSVSLPSSVISIVPQTDSGFTVNAIPSGMMETSSLTKTGEYITLSASADISNIYEMPCYPLFLKAHELSPSIQSDFQTAFSDAKTYLEDYAANSLVCSDINSCSEKLTDEFRGRLLGKDQPFVRDNYLITPEVTEASAVVRIMDAGKVKRYELSATQKVTINETGTNAKYYPVWNGTDISFENMELVYVTGLTASTEI